MFEPKHELLLLIKESLSQSLLQLLLLDQNEFFQFGLKLMDLIHLLGVVLIQLFILYFLQLLESLELRVKLVVPGIEHRGLEEKGT